MTQIEPLTAIRTTELRFAPRFGPRQPSRDDGLQRARRPDAVAMAQLFARTYGTESSHPAVHASFIEGSLAAGDIWVLSREGGAITGCGAVRSTAWDGVVEVGCLVVDRERQSRGLARRMVDHMLLEAVRTRPFALALACHRSSAPLSIGERAKALPVHMTGHDGGIDLAAGRPEIHAIATGASPRGHMRRAALGTDHPLRPVEHLVPWLATTVDQHIAWPNDVTVGPGAMPVSSSARSTAPMIDGHTGAALIPAMQAPSARDALRWLSDVAGRLGDARIVTAYVLADKLDVIAASADLGFRPTAWLPAWYAHGGRRFDCVMLTRAAAHENPDPTLLARAMEWEERLVGLLQGDRRRG